MRIYAQQECDPGPLVFSHYEATMKQATVLDWVGTASATKHAHHSWCHTTVLFCRKFSHLHTFLTRSANQEPGQMLCLVCQFRSNHIPFVLCSYKGVWYLIMVAFTSIPRSARRWIWLSKHWDFSRPCLKRLVPKRSGDTTKPLFFPDSWKRLVLTLNERVIDVAEWWPICRCSLSSKLVSLYDFPSRRPFGPPCLPSLSASWFPSGLLFAAAATLSFSAEEAFCFLSLLHRTGTNPLFAGQL